MFKPKTLIKLPSKSFNQYLERLRRRIRRGVAHASSENQAISEKILCYDRRAEFSSTLDNNFSMNRFSVYDGNINNLPKSKRKEIFYIPLTDSDFAYLKFFDQPTAKHIIAAGRAGLYWEVSF